MGEKRVAAHSVARHLNDAIDRVREDMAKVEFWADAVTGFSQPVPDYESKDMKVWLPSEQAKTISSTQRDNDKPQKQSVASKRR